MGTEENILRETIRRYMCTCAYWIPLLGVARELHVPNVESFISRC